MKKCHFSFVAMAGCLLAGMTLLVSCDKPSFEPSPTALLDAQKLQQDLTASIELPDPVIIGFSDIDHDLDSLIYDWRRPYNNPYEVAINWDFGLQQITVEMQLLGPASATPPDPADYLSTGDLDDMVTWATAYAELAEPEACGLTTHTREADDGSWFTFDECE